MHAQAKSECGCGKATCGCLPGDFTRLRYFFGQHLGVADFNDQLAYDIGKHRFVNRHLHGSGVLCGLRAERMVFPQSSDPTSPTSLLRVTKGAAIDGCGREVLVPVDQCIDVNGWLAKNRERPDVQAWSMGQTAPVWVGLRYRECPSDPSPAPRDPCGCDAGGCEYSRVLEGFELALLTADELAELKNETFPPTDDLLNAIISPEPASSLSVTTLQERLATMAAHDCPDGCGCGWLILARVTLSLEPQDPPQVIDIASTEVGIPERRALLSTSTLQGLVQSLIEAGVAAGVVGNGPKITGPIQFSAMGGDSGQLFVDITLAKAGTPLSAVALLDTTFQSKYVVVTRFDEASKTWSVLDSTTTYSPERFSITVTSGLVAGAYRLTVSAPPESPIVDERLQPLRPERYSTSFGLALGADGALHLDTTTVG